MNTNRIPGPLGIYPQSNKPQRHVHLLPQSNFRYPGALQSSITKRRENDFSAKTKKGAIARQNGVCAFCGVSLKTPFSDGEYQGYAHHLQPIYHGGTDSIDNCVCLCWAHHQLIGHGMAPFGIENQSYLKGSCRDY